MYSLPSFCENEILSLLTDGEFSILQLRQAALLVCKGLVLGVLLIQVPPGMFRVKSYIINILLDAVISQAGSKELAWNLANLTRTALISLNVPHCAPARMTRAQWHQQCKLLNIQLILLTGLGIFGLISRANVFLLSPVPFFSSHLSSWEAVWVDLGERSALRQMGIFFPKKTYFFRQSLSGSYSFLLCFQKNLSFLSCNLSCFLLALIPC